MALAVLGIVILALLAWGVSEGAFYLGARVGRDDRPLAFWLEAVAIGAIGAGILYLAMFATWLFDSSASRRR